jgi:CheY-like chemotaxis protein
VIEAADGHEAMDVALRIDLHLDLLVTDLVMPGMSGRELIAQFAVVRPGVPMIAITGFAGESDQPVADDVGLSGLVTKPFSADALLRAVAAACDPRSFTEKAKDLAEKA